MPVLVLEAGTSVRATSRVAGADCLLFVVEIGRGAAFAGTEPVLDVRVRAGTVGGAALTGTALASGAKVVATVIGVGNLDDDAGSVPIVVAAALAAWTSVRATSGS